MLKKFEQSAKPIDDFSHNVKIRYSIYIRRLLVHQMIDEFPAFFQKIPAGQTLGNVSNGAGYIGYSVSGDYKIIFLKLLTHVLGLPSSKDDIDGSEVGKGILS